MTCRFQALRNGLKSVRSGRTCAVVTTLADSPRASRTPDAPSVGVIVWLASELMFFAGLFAGWFTLRAENHPWPPDGVELDDRRARRSPP